MIVVGLPELEEEVIVFELVGGLVEVVITVLLCAGVVVVLELMDDEVEVETEEVVLRVTPVRIEALVVVVLSVTPVRIEAFDVDDVVL